MQKLFLKTSGILLCTFLLFSGCKKNIDEPADDSTEKLASRNGNSEKNENKCRLVTFDWSAGGAGLWRYQYNSKGLADIWSIEYPEGIISEKIFYNKDDQIIRAEEDYFGSDYLYQFYYTRNQLIRLTRINVEFPEDKIDVRYIYNKKGENIRQDDVIRDEHVLMYYDAMGNCTRTDIYLGSELWLSDNYTFNAPVKNPWLYVPGIEYGFLNYGGTYAMDKRMFTSNRTLIYDADGTALVLNDYDPSRTVIKTGSKNLPISAMYYDRASQSTVTINLDYENCGKGYESDQNNRAAVKATYQLEIKNKLSRMSHLSPKERKEQVRVIRNALRGK